MSNNFYLTIGRIFFAAGVIAIGMVHFVTGNFPTGLLPVAAWFPGREILVYLSGALLVVSGLLILVTKSSCYGAVLAAITWLVFLLALHLPKLIMAIKDPNEWAPAFEVAMLFDGALILTGIVYTKKFTRFNLVQLGSYCFAADLLVFAIQHFMYAKFIAMLIFPWVPWRLFWSYFVGVAFLAAAISIISKKLVRLAMLLLGLMFFIWVCMLHIPLVVLHLKMPDAEAEWTSLFVALTVSGISFLIAGSQVNGFKERVTGLSILRII